MTVEERMRRRFSESFRMEQVVLIESGKLSVGEVSLLYEVKREGVRNWLKKYGKLSLPSPIIIKSSKEVNRLKDLEKEVSKLKLIIGDQQVKLIYQEGLLAVAKEKLEDDFEKKP